MNFYPRMRVTFMPDRKNKLIPRPKIYLKSGIIHDWAKVVAILIFFQNGGPLGGAPLGVRQKSKQYAIRDMCPDYEEFYTRHCRLCSQLRAAVSNTTKSPLHYYCVADILWRCVV